MGKVFLIVVCVFSLLMNNGCRLAENVGGWDLTACVGDFDVCWELFSDNTDKFETETEG